MGIVNVTPDSFSDGGRFLGVEQAVAHGMGLASEGADWLDIGGESTRPGAARVSADVEAARVVPVIRALHAALPDLVLSVDTSKASVADAALEAGAVVVNDVTAARDPRMLSVVAERGASLVLMHMRGDPVSMQQDTHYDDVVLEVVSFLSARLAAALAAGVRADGIWLDPGVGFGKAPADNPRLIAAVTRLEALCQPVLIGASRKRFIGQLTGVERASERVHGSVGAALAAAHHGADVLRVHDVSATIEALCVFRACGG